MGPEFEKGDGRLRPSLQQRLPGAEGPPEGCTTAPRHAACGGPLPSSAEGPCVIYLFSWEFAVLAAMLSRLIALRQPVGAADRALLHN